MPGADRQLFQMPARSLQKPLLFVDVDGVISPFGFSAEKEAEEHAWQVHHLGAEPLIIPDGMPARLQQLEDHFECVYATSYEFAARELASVLGTKQWGAVLWTATGGHDWKWEPLLAYARRRPFAWIDDEISSEILDVATGLTAGGQAILPLPVEPTIGLTDQQVQVLINWACVSGS